MTDSTTSMAEAVTGFLETPDGGRVRYARWLPEVAPQATVLLLNGRCEFIEKYDALAQDWLRRGFRVFAMDWRGQGLSSRFLPEPHHRRGHIPDFAHLVDDLDQVLDTVIAPAQVGPLVVFAHSMGGLIALHAAIRRPHRARALVLSAPMLGFRTDPLPSWLVAATARAAVRFGLGDGYALGQRDYEAALDGAFADNPLTSDPDRYAVLHQWCRRNPDLALGGVTYGWLDAGFRAIAALDAPGTVESLEAPVLLLSASADRLVSASAHEAIARRLSHATLRRYPEARHEPLMEADPIRDRVWADIDVFLAEVLGPSFQKLGFQKPGMDGRNIP